MENNLLVIFFIIISLLLGIFIGFIFFKFNMKRIETNLILNAEEFMEGKRENKISIDGVEYEAKRFRLRDENGKEIVIEAGKDGK